MDRPSGSALRYDGPGAQGPVKAARGLPAERIDALARENDIPLHEDAGLIEALARLEIGADIPRELYAVVAEVVAFLYRVDGEAGTTP